MPQSDNGGCSHLRVHRETRPAEGNSVFSVWVCVMCGHAFQPLPDAEKAEAADGNAGLRELRAWVIDETATPATAMMRDEIDRILEDAPQPSVEPDTCPEVMAWGICTESMPCRHHTPSASVAPEPERDDGPLDRFLTDYEREGMTSILTDDAAIAELCRREKARGPK